jgi:hypothetical protein
MLQDLVDKTVLVRLKWGETEYKGRLVVSRAQSFGRKAIVCPD